MVLGKSKPIFLAAYCHSCGDVGLAFIPTTVSIDPKVKDRTMTNLRELAVAAKQWPLNTFKPATEEDACIVGHTDQDGEFYPVL